MTTRRTAAERKPVLSRAKLIAAKNEMLADRFAMLCRIHGVPLPEREVRFDATRKWQFDFAWPTKRIALEVEGGVWTGGRHTRGAGFLKDMEKYNSATACGWMVFRTTPDQLCEASTLALLDTVFKTTAMLRHFDTAELTLDMRTLNTDIRP